MKLIEFKNSYLAQQSQFTTFNINGDVVDSCDTFFELNSKNIFQYFDFLEALKKDILNENNIKNPLTIPRIESKQKDKIFDFVFKIIELNNNKINLLIIHNEKDSYKYLKKVQQERNEAILKLNEK